MSSPTSSQPYLIRAIYDWIVDNSMTPHLLVDVTVRDVKIPESFSKDERLVLNISPSAVINLSISNTSIEFRARFSGVERDIFLSIDSVLAIYAKENGSGMTFDEGKVSPDQASGDSKDSNVVSRPTLKIVK